MCIFMCTEIASTAVILRAVSRNFVIRLLSPAYTSLHTWQYPKSIIYFKRMFNILHYYINRFEYKSLCNIVIFHNFMETTYIDICNYTRNSTAIATFIRIRIIILKLTMAHVLNILLNSGLLFKLYTRPNVCPVACIAEFHDEMIIEINV